MYSVLGCCLIDLCQGFRRAKTYPPISDYVLLLYGARPVTWTHCVDLEGLYGKVRFYGDVHM